MTGRRAERKETETAELKRKIGDSKSGQKMKLICEMAVVDAIHELA